MQIKQRTESLHPLSPPPCIVCSPLHTQNDMQLTEVQSSKGDKGLVDSFLM